GATEDDVGIGYQRQVRRAAADGQRRGGRLHVVHTEGDGTGGRVRGGRPIGDVGDGRQVVDRGDGDGEGLRGRGVDATVGGTAAIPHDHREGRGAEGIGSRRVRQRAVGGDARRGGEQGRVADIADRIGIHSLTRLVG